ncbi:MAG: hypothetical protein IZT55_06125 [Anaerolineae bacterium]|nr:hypothetical protein [Anaerolineae bacterium]
MKIFIAGIMQGSEKGKGIQSQDYRQIISDAVTVNHPNAEIVDPFTLFPDSVTYDDQRAKQVLFELAAEAGSSDILIAYLPKASMGTTLEMVRSYDNGKRIISISPMESNWVVRAFSDKIFSTMDEFCTWVFQTNLEDLVDASSP